MSEKVKVTFRGWPGHFICASRCEFRLNTLLEYKDIRIVVSTVGRYKNTNKYEKIGLNRYYETMAFYAKNDGVFWDADVEREIGFDSNWVYSKITEESEANNGHYKVIEEIKSKLLKGVYK